MQHFGNWKKVSKDRKASHRYRDCEECMQTEPKFQYKVANTVNEEQPRNLADPILVSGSLTTAGHTTAESPTVSGQTRAETLEAPDHTTAAESPTDPAHTTADTSQSPGQTRKNTAEAPGHTTTYTPEAPGHTIAESPTVSGQTTAKTPDAPGHTITYTPEAPGHTTAESPTVSGQTRAETPEAPDHTTAAESPTDPAHMTADTPQSIRQTTENTPEAPGHTTTYTPEAPGHTTTYTPEAPGHTTAHCITPLNRVLPQQSDIRPVRASSPHLVLAESSMSSSIRLLDSTADSLQLTRLDLSAITDQSATVVQTPPPRKKARSLQHILKELSPAEQNIYERHIVKKVMKQQKENSIEADLAALYSNDKMSQLRWDIQRTDQFCSYVPNRQTTHVSRLDSYQFDREKAKEYLGAEKKLGSSMAGKWTDMAKQLAMKNKYGKPYTEFNSGQVNLHSVEVRVRCYKITI